MVQETVRDFARQEIAPRARQIDEREEFPADVIQKMAALNLLGIPFPEEYGGAGGDYLSYILAMEEIAKVCGSTALTLAAHVSLGTWPIYAFGTEEQRRKFVPPLARGERLGGFGLTEPNAGSDSSGTQTTAVPAGDDWVLNGTKTFNTNGGVAGTFIVTAMVDRTQGAHGIGAFIVEKGYPGFAVGKVEKKLGCRGSNTVELILQDCHVPATNLVGKPDEGFKIFMKTLDGGRISIAAMALGLAAGAFEKSVAYAKERRAFGSPIGSFQAIQWMLADMAMEIEASRHLIYHAAQLKDAGKPYTKEASMAKLFASETAMRATFKAIQIHGGYGFVREYDVERMWRDAKLCEIGEGTSEIQRLIIARQILGKFE
ncbi:MAG: acyl-CoA dehydrogenase [Planctomycetes bacterium]|nr:acyl-CoA dehydrogenase [Planctomycetota bacterium]